MRSSLAWLINLAFFGAAVASEKNPADRWQYRTFSSAMTDANSFRTALKSESSTAYLHIGCTESRIPLFMLQTSYPISVRDNAWVGWRFDRSDAQWDHWEVHSTLKAVTWFGKRNSDLGRTAYIKQYATILDEIERINESKKLTVEIPNLRGGKSVGVFNVSDLSSIFVKMNNDCSYDRYYR